MGILAQNLPELCLNFGILGIAAQNLPELCLNFVSSHKDTKVLERVLKCLKAGLSICLLVSNMERN
jgi:hypothetical protein